MQRELISWPLSGLRNARRNQPRSCRGARRSGEVGRAEFGDLGDGVVVWAGEVLGTVGGRVREGTAQSVDEVMVVVAREQGSEGLAVWVGNGKGHDSAVIAVWEEAGQGKFSQNMLYMRRI